MLILLLAFIIAASVRGATNRAHQCLSASHDIAQSLEREPDLAEPARYLAKAHQAAFRFA
ncbi:hypothetical protein AX777_04880 [Sphingobium yanoikuyae]|uniref:Uncharacterized protein n=1 Tax=Sphingobium yanoikuyae TaxID=13690 RepID=A0A177JNU0_SPHYA|nr:hypothetical protein AX777_04880 [Sphingobium yanoikuyae]